MDFNDYYDIWMWLCFEFLKIDIYNNVYIYDMNWVMIDLNWMNG
jgi:hypothetical protein